MHVEERIAAFAARQDDLITAAQLKRAGLGRGAIRHRLAVGSLRRVYRGVYALGAAPVTGRRRIRAAVMALAPRAAASHRTAAYLHGIVDEHPGAVEVTVWGRNPGRPAGVVVHRSRLLDRADIKPIAGIPATTVPRALLDLAATDPEVLVTDALARRKVSDRQLRRYAEAHRSHPGAARILAVLATEREHGYSRSAAERLLRRLLKPTGLPMPRFNVMVNGALVDCLWQRERLILEVDGYGTHGGRAAFERDRLRDQRHAAAGYVAIRVTWRQLTRRPPAVLTRVAQALALRGARAS